MGILIAVALICTICFAVAVVARTVVGALGGVEPEWGPARRLAQLGEAKLALAGIDREYRDLLRS